ncbi:unnamed protein product, partial [Hapterophycus canaliculatus]
DRPGLASTHSLVIVVNALPDPPSWSAPGSPLMAAEDEAMVVAGVSVADPDDGETRLRVDAWAKEGKVGLAQGVNASYSLDVEEGAGDSDSGHGSLVLTGNETALNLALAGLVY